MAARAHLRLGVCQEKLGLAQARQTYEAVRDKYPDQPQVRAEATRRLRSTHQREAIIERPSSLTASEFEIHSLLQQLEKRPSLIADADSDEWVRRMQDAIGRIDSVLSDEQMHRQLETLRRQMKHVEWQMKHAERQMKYAEQQMKRGSGDHSTFLDERLHGIQDYVESIKSSLGVGVDSVFIDEQVRRQLKALQQQMKHAEQQMKHAKQQIDWQNQSGYDHPFHDNILLSWKFLGTERKTDIKKFLRRATDIDPVAKVPTKWEFHLDADRKSMERPSRFHEYAPANFDDAEWANIEIGRPWADQGYADYEGGGLVSYQAHNSGRSRASSTNVY